MKKLTTILFSVVMLLSLCFGLVGCDKGNDDQGNETVDFSSANYGDYIAINVEFDTPEIVTVYASTGAVIGYSLYCRGTTIVKKCANVQFENCSLHINVTRVGWPSSSVGRYGNTIELSYDGEGTGTFTLYDFISGERTDIDLSVPLSQSYNVSKVEGKIVINP